LISLEGAPKKVKGNFNCSGNQLSALDGTLKKVGGDFISGKNCQPFHDAQVRAVFNVKGNCIS
jgi:hypothetical protein